MSGQKAYLAGGCFWGVEELFRKLPGVSNTEVGYAGGEVDSPVYQTVSTGTTGHAETIEIEFDSTVLPYEELLLYFFKIHNPTTPNQQGNDIGSQYRSVIFYLDEAQKNTAEKVIARVEASKAWGSPLVTQVLPFTAFWPAEAYHQDYLQKEPQGYTCHFERPLKF